MCVCARVCVCVQTHIVTQMVKSLPAVQETRVQSLDLEGALEKGMVTHSSILVWKIPWTEEPSGLPSMGSHRVALSCVQLFATPFTIAYQAPPSMGFSRQEYWSGLPFPSPGDLPDPGTEPRSPTL